jgi:hypothetical protein
METPLHSQKLAILSRLIKESSLTLEEALLLLKDEETEVVDNQPSTISNYPPLTTPFTIPLVNIPHGTRTLSGSGTINTSGIMFTTSNNTLGSSLTASLTNTNTEDANL